MSHRLWSARIYDTAKILCQKTRGGMLTECLMFTDGRVKVKVSGTNYNGRINRDSLIMFGKQMKIVD